MSQCRQMKTKLLAAVLAAFVIAGCGPANKLVGTWDGGPGEITFNSDGTFNAVSTKPPPNMPSLKMTMSGKYELKDDAKTLTVTVTKADITGLPAAAQAMADQQKAAFMNKPQVSTLEWKSDDEVVGKETNGATTTYRRKK